MGKCLLSIDVEDWFHILDLPSTPKIEQWSSLSSLVEKNFLTLLDLLEKNKVISTCFILGWVAEKFPPLVKEAARRGHEIASHGYAHRLVNEMTEQEFFEDVVKTKNILESIIEKPILGYRASGFSVTEELTWFFQKLIDAGYQYDSSVFPAPRGHGGMKTDKFAPYKLNIRDKQIIEMPITIAKTFGKPFCFFGGGYLRLFPYSIIKYKIKQVFKDNRPVIIYVHPREIDSEHPRLPMNFKRKIKTYINIKTTEKKLQKIFNDFECGTIINYINSNEIPEIYLESVR
jgi:polysaccharide deacetylase family protein (PEP-CTERM system associated)